MQRVSLLKDGCWPVPTTTFWRKEWPPTAFSEAGGGAAPLIQVSNPFTMPVLSAFLLERLPSKIQTSVPETKVSPVLIP